MLPNINIDAKLHPRNDSDQARFSANSVNWCR